MKAKVNWKPVTISGVSGILMGAGTVYATQHLSDAEGVVAEPSAQPKEWTADNSLSFKHAFDAAREELGPGAVFHWRGNIYSTYTAEEWNAMSTEEKDLFAQQVNPEVSAEDIDTTQLEEEAQLAEVTVEEAKEETEDLAQNVTEQPESDVNIVNDNEDVAVVAANDGEQEEEQPSGDDDVRIIGYGDIDLANGRSVTVQELEINGQRVAVIDVDKDGVGDIAMCDVNNNHQADDGEIIDLHTGEALSFNHQTTNDDEEVMDLSMTDL